MAADVVPALNEAIMTSYRSRMNRDARIRRVSKRIKDGTATLQDGHTYAAAAGENMSSALRSVLTPENLPDGKLYYNIADRTIKPALRETYNTVNTTAADVQKIVDRKSKIRMASVRADFPEDRIDGLIEKVVENIDDVDGALKWIGEPIVNNVEAFFDDFVDRNAEVRVRSGMQAKITRTAESNCCPWCADKEGSWDYGDEPDDVYARHEYCRCTVTYTADRKAQNVWSKEQWEPSPEAYDRMRSAAARTPQPMTQSERADAIASRRKAIKRAVNGQ